ncbi:hypothetical protein [Hymenobacter metallicola]|nr:hypothetical protein [Hymenobacter metallicola]
MKQPKGIMPTTIRQQILQLVGLPLFNGVFQQVEEIDVGEGDELTAP